MPENVESIRVQDLSADQRKTLTALKRPVLDVSKQFGIVREKLSNLAPKVIRLFNQIAAETDRFTFVDFCRLFDSTVPTHAADRQGATGYRNHRTYQTLDYMRRIVRSTGQRRGRQGVRDSAVDDLARLLATILQFTNDPEAVWSAAQSEFQYSERIMTRLRKRVEATKPILKFAIKHPVQVANVVHMEPQVKPAEQPPAEIPARGGKYRAA